MFLLTENDLQKTFLGCGDGPASFNAELTRSEGQVISLDPIYQFSRRRIQERIEATSDEVIKQTRNNKQLFNWTTIRSVDELAAIRLKAMDSFLEDFDHGKIQGRYQCGALPHLPFTDNAFQLSLCSHLLFLYSEQLSYDFHYQAIDELLRVAEEVRVFPLVDLSAQPSCHLDPLMKTLSNKGFSYRIETSDYHFQKGGSELLIITSHNNH